MLQHHCVSREVRNARYQAAAATTTLTDNICRQYHSASVTLLRPVGRDWNGDVNVGYVHTQDRIMKLRGKPTSSGVPRGVVWGVQTPPEIPKLSVKSSIA